MEKMKVSRLIIGYTVAKRTDLRTAADSEAAFIIGFHSVLSWIRT